MRECKLRSGVNSQGALMQKDIKKGVEQGLDTTNLQPYLRYMTAVTKPKQAFNEVNTAYSYLITLI